MKETIADITLALGIAVVLCGLALAYFDVLTY